MGTMARRKRDGFYKRDGSPFWWTRDPRDGQRKSTKCKDLEAARLTRARWERAAADPAHAAAETATLDEWCGRFVAWKGKASSEATAAIARQKLGHWVRLFGTSTALSVFSEPTAFDTYVSSRRSEGASDHTISKEVAHMLAVLKLAKRGKCFAGDLSTLRPPDLHAGYKPRERTLTRAELAALLSELKPHRAVWVAVGVALGCRLGEVSRMLPTDIDWVEDRVLIRGTKTAGSRRYLPILSLYRPLLEAAAPYLPVKPWGKIWRDIGAACKRAGIAHCSTNDFRRTHATLLAEADVSPDVIRRLLGHTTDTLVKQVYARPSAKALATLAEGKLLGAAPLLPEKDFGDISGRYPSMTPTPAGGGPVEPAFQGAVDRYGDGPDCSSGGPRPNSVRFRDAPPGSEVMATGELPTLADGVRFLAGPPPTVEFRYVTLPAEADQENDENTEKAPVAQWTEQRFPKPEPHVEVSAGILGFRGDARRWVPPDAPGSGRERQAGCTGRAQ